MRGNQMYEEEYEEWENGKIDWDNFSTSIRAWLSSQQKQAERWNQGEPTICQQIFEFVAARGEKGANVNPEIVNGTGIPIEVASTYVSKMCLHDGVLRLTGEERPTPNGELASVYVVAEILQPSKTLTVKLEIKKAMWRELLLMMECDGGENCSCGPDVESIDYDHIKKYPDDSAAIRNMALSLLWGVADKHFKYRHGTENTY